MAYFVMRADNPAKQQFFWDGGPPESPASWLPQPYDAKRFFVPGAAQESAAAIAAHDIPAVVTKFSSYELTDTPRPYDP